MSKRKNPLPALVKKAADAIVVYLKQHRTFTIDGFGRFEVYVPEGKHHGISPKKGEPYTHKTVKFIPSRVLKKKLNEGEQNDERKEQ